MTSIGTGNLEIVQRTGKSVRAVAFCLFPLDILIRIGGIFLLSHLLQRLTCRQLATRLGLGHLARLQLDEEDPHRTSDAAFPAENIALLLVWSLTLVATPADPNVAVRYQ
jgi:hypothetical protein